MATDWSKIYFEGRESGDADKMEYANRQANIEKGLGDIVTATEDIAKVRASTQTKSVGVNKTIQPVSLQSSPVMQESRPVVAAQQQITSPIAVKAEERTLAPAIYADSGPAHSISATPQSDGSVTYHTSDGNTWTEPATAQKNLTQADVQSAIAEALARYRAQQPKSLTVEDVQSIMSQALAAQAQQQKQSQYELTEYLKQQRAAQLESALAGLKDAYTTSRAGLQSARDRLPQTYDAARNATAAQAALTQRNFDERAAASGLSTGATGQAALSRSSALIGSLAGIDQAQANAEADIDLQMETLASQYQTAIQQARAAGDSELATALYQELVRVQGLERQDAIRAEERADADEALAYNRALAVEQTAYSREQTARNEAKQRIDTYLAALGDPSVLSADLVARSGYTPAEISSLAAYYTAQQTAAAAADSSPATILDTMRSFGDDSQAYAYLAGKGLNKDVTAQLWQYYNQGAGTVTPTTVRPGGSGGVGYYNGSLSSSQVKALQGALGVTRDGYFGPTSQAAAKAKYGTNDPDAAWRAYQNGTAQPVTLGAAAQRLATAIQNRGPSTTNSELASRIQYAINSGSITDREADYLLTLAGV